MAAESNSTPSLNPQPLTLEYELNELADEMLMLLMLAEAAQNEIALERVQQMFDHCCQAAKLLGFKSYFHEIDGHIAVNWTARERP